MSIVLFHYLGQNYELPVSPHDHSFLLLLFGKIHFRR